MCNEQIVIGGWLAAHATTNVNMSSSSIGTSLEVTQASQLATTGVVYCVHQLDPHISILFSKLHCGSYAIRGINKQSPQEIVAKRATTTRHVTTSRCYMLRDLLQELACSVVDRSRSMQICEVENNITILPAQEMNSLQVDIPLQERAVRYCTNCTDKKYSL